MLKPKHTTLLLIIILGLIAPVSAHGVHLTPDSAQTIVMADNSTGPLAKGVVDELGLNITVYSFQSQADVTHELEHLLTNPQKKILAVAYLDTVQEFLAQNPQVSDQIVISNPDQETIKKGLNRLNSTTTETSYGFLTPFLSGILMGALTGLGMGAFLMKRKLK